MRYALAVLAGLAWLVTASAADTARLARVHCATNLVATGTVVSAGTQKMRVCCSGGGALTVEDGSADKASNVPCAPAAAPTDACCYDITGALTGALSIAATAGVAAGMGDVPSEWSYLVDDGAQYVSWVPTYTAAWDQAQTKCQEGGALLLDVPQASVGANTRPSAADSTWAKGKAILDSVLRGIPVRLASGARLWLGSRTYNRAFAGTQTIDFNKGPQPISGLETDCPPYPVWETSGVYDKSASGVADPNKAGSCLSALLSDNLIKAGTPPPASPYDYTQDCTLATPAICTKPRGFGRVSTDADLISASLSFKECTDTCGTRFSGRLINADSRFKRQYVYAMMRSAVPTLEDGYFRAWAGATYQNGGWAWAGSEAPFPSTVAAGWYEQNADGSQGVSAWYNDTSATVDVPDNSSDHTIVGRYEGYKWGNYGRFGNPACLYADPDNTAYADGSVLYQWGLAGVSSGSGDATDSETFKCACEIPGPEVTLQGARMIQCAGADVIAVAVARNASGALNFAGRCRGWDASSLSAWRQSVVQNPSSGITATQSVGGCREAGPIAYLQFQFDDKGIAAVSVACAGEADMSNQVADWSTVNKLASGGIPGGSWAGASVVNVGALTPAGQTPASSEDGSGGGSGVKTGLIIGIVLGAIALCCICSIVGLLCVRRRKAQEWYGSPRGPMDLKAASPTVLKGRGGKDADSYIVYQNQAPTGTSMEEVYVNENDAFGATLGASRSLPNSQYEPASKQFDSGKGAAAHYGAAAGANNLHFSVGTDSTAWQNSAVVLGMGSTATASTAVSTKDPYTAVRGPEGGPSEIEDPLDRLDDQLDQLTEAGPFLGRFVLSGLFQRRRGGQGLVQFATGVTDKREYAIKFFTHQSAFQHEQDLYCNAALHKVLPSIEDIRPNYDHAITDPSGTPLPSFIILEKGESLDEWTRRRTPDFPTTLQVLCHVAERLVKLHEAGLVHRDLKHANTLWLPNRNEWTLLDFGCAAMIGERASVSYSLRYAAPEVLAAAEAGQTSMVALGSLDVWSLGVMAYELLTSTEAFDMTQSPQEVTDQIMGRSQAPWEDMTTVKRRQMGVMRKSVLGMLNREAALRPDMPTLLATWCNLFAGTTTQRTIVSNTDSERITS